MGLREQSLTNCEQACKQLNIQTHTFILHTSLHKGHHTAEDREGWLQLQATTAGWLAQHPFFLGLPVVVVATGAVELTTPGWPGRIKTCKCRTGVTIFAETVNTKCSEQAV